MNNAAPAVTLRVMIPLSVLDLAPITEGSDAATALARSRDLARHAERLGYLRYWVAEHHNMPGIASAAGTRAVPHGARDRATGRVRWRHRRDRKSVV